MCSVQSIGCAEAVSCNWAMSHNERNGDPIGKQDKDVWESIKDRWEELHGERWK